MKLFLFLLSFSALAQFTPTDRQYSGNLNELINPSFTQGKTGWATTGTGASFTVTSTGAVYPGSKAALVSFSSSPTTAKFSQVLTATSNIDQQYLSVWATTTSSTLRVGAFVDGVETVGINLNGNGQPNLYTFPFVGKVNREIRVYPTATTTGTVALSEAYLGVAGNLKQQVDGSRKIGQVRITGCTAISTTSASFIDLTGATGCSYQVTGDVEAPTSGTFGVRLRNKQQGSYRFDVTGLIPYASGQAACTLGLRLGSTNSSGEVQSEGNGNGWGVGVFGVDYPTTISDETVFLRAKRLAGAGTCQLYASNTYPLTIDVYYFPPQSSIYSAPAPQAAQIKWYSVANCSAVSSSGSWTSITDTDCTFASASKIGDPQSPTTTGAIALKKFFPAGRYRISFGGHYGDFNNPAQCAFRLTDGVNIVGAVQNGSQAAGRIYNDGVSQVVEYTTATTVDWTLQTVRLGGTGDCGMSALGDTNGFWISAEPISNTITGSFEGIEKCTDAFQCTNEFSAKVSNTGVISDENLDWINGNCTQPGGTGTYACTFKSGLFSVAPNCSLQVAEASNVFPVITSKSNTSIGWRSTNASGTFLNTSHEIICQKQGVDFLPRTAIAGVNTTVVTTPGVSAPKMCSFKFNGGNENTSCTSNPCTVQHLKGNCISSVTWGGTGDYYINFNPSYWSDNSYTCERSMTWYSGGAASARVHFINGVRTATTLRFNSLAGGSGENTAWEFTCHGE